MAQERQAGTFFISFASHDYPIAADLAAQLQGQGLATFFAPRDIDAGENFALRIVQAIVECETVVVLLSASAISSPHVRREVALAIDERRRLVPVTLAAIRFPQDFTTEWSYWLSAVQVVGFTTVDNLVDVLTAEQAAELDRPVFDTGGKAAERHLPVTRTPDVISPVSLLRPEIAVVPFAGREDELTRLSSWLDRKERLSIRLVTAPGGHGKSRLAQELIAKSVSTGWDAAFIRDLATASFRRVSEPTLRVVDYAETKGPELAEMIQQLSLLRLDVPVRVLLLARSASDWWRTLGSSSAEVETVLTDAVVQELAPLVKDPAVATDLYSAAVCSFAGAIGVRVPEIGATAEESDSIVDLLQRALLAVLSDSQSEDSFRVIQRLLGHERRYVRVAAAAAGLEHFDDVDFDRIAALFTLFPPQDEPQAVELATIAQPRSAPQDHRRLARLLRRVYPGSSSYSSGLKPDAVAEFAIAGLLAEDGGIPGGLDTWALINDERYENGMRVLARAAVTAHSAQAELEKVVGGSGVPRLKIALEVALQVESPFAVASAISTAAMGGRFDGDLDSAMGLLPEETIALSEVGAVLAERLMTRLDSSGESPRRNGFLLVEASSRFSDAGWNAKALEAVSAGIAELRQDLSGSVRLELGRALSNLSNRLWETGELEASLDPAAEAVDLLVPGADRIALLGARNNLAFRYIEAGRYGEARIQCELAQELIRAGGFMAGRGRHSALALENNLVCLEAATGEWESAAERAVALVERRRSDYAVHRDRNLAYLARALANSSIPFAALGDAERAAMAIAEARALHRITAARAPIFAFEAAESALIDAVGCALADSPQSAWEALDAAQGTAESVRTEVGSLAVRVDDAIAAFAVGLADGSPLGRDELAAIGGAEGSRSPFPLLLEYKDL